MRFYGILQENHTPNNCLAQLEGLHDSELCSRTSQKRAELPLLRSSGGADPYTVLGTPGGSWDKLRGRVSQHWLRDPDTRTTISSSGALDLVAEDLIEDPIAGRRMQAAAADRVGIGSGCEPAGLARWAPRSGVGVGGLLSLRRFVLWRRPLSAGARFRLGLASPLRGRRTVQRRPFRWRRSGRPSALPRHQRTRCALIGRAPSAPPRLVPGVASSACRPPIEGGRDSPEMCQYGRDLRLRCLERREKPLTNAP